MPCAQGGGHPPMSHPRSGSPRAALIKLALLALVALGAMLFVAAQGRSATTPAQPAKQAKRINQAQREAAARRAARQGMTSAVTALAQAQAGVETAAAVTDKTPHFYGPFANYANSPLPTVQGGVIEVGNKLIQRANATDYATPPGNFGRVFVTVPQKLPNGLLKAFKTFNQTDPAGSPTSSEGGVFHAYVLRPTGTADEYKIVHDSGELVVPAATDSGGNVVSYPMADLAVKDGDVLGFYGQGIPVDTGTGTDTLSYPAPIEPPLLDSTIKVGSAEYPKTDTSRTYSFAADVVDLSGN